MYNLTLYGRFDKETKRAREILDSKEIKYRFEGSCPKDEPITLVGFGVRLQGLSLIEQMFG